MRKAANVERMEERTRGRRAAARREEKGKRRVAKESPEHVGRAARQDSWCREGGNKHFFSPLTKTTVKTLKKTTENEEDLLAIMVLVGRM